MLKTTSFIRMSVKLVICTPAYDGQVNHRYMLSYIKLHTLCIQRNIEVVVIFTAKDSMITRARNFLCKSFLDIDNATHLLFVDADIQYEPEDVLRMLDADVPLIGGVYAKKTMERDHITGKQIVNYCVVPAEGTTIVNDLTKPHPVLFVGTGLMLLKREVLETMIRAFPDDFYFAEPNEKFYRFFDTERVGSAYLSEDYFFCHKWRSLGHTVYAAYWTRTVHWGMHGYEGNVLASALPSAIS